MRDRNVGREVFVGVADKLDSQGQKERARRVLSNLFFDPEGVDVSGVREVMYRAHLAEDKKFSLGLADVLVQLNRRDMRFVYESWLINKVKQKGFTDWLYRNFFRAGGEDTFSHGLVMMEMNRLQLKLPENEMDYGGIQFLGEGHFPSDVRVVVLTSDETSSSFMNVTDPAGVVVSGNEVGLTGGWSRCDGGLAEFMVRKAIPGKYQIKLQAKGCYLVQVWTNWGREGEKKQTYIVSGGKTGVIDGGVIEFDIKQ